MGAESSTVWKPAMGLAHGVWAQGQYDCQEVRGQCHRSTRSLSGNFHTAGLRMPEGESVSANTQPLLQHSLYFSAGSASVLR